MSMKQLITEMVSAHIQADMNEVLVKHAEEAYEIKKLQE